MVRRLPSAVGRLTLAVAVAAAVAACYLPVRFDAEAVITRTGYYDLSFRGRIAWLPLARELRERRIGQAEEREKVRRIETDLERDSATRSLRYAGNGQFDIDWRRSGDLFRVGMVSFVRRNESIFRIKYVATTGHITLEGRSLRPEQARDLARYGLGTEGELKVKTDAAVVDHNALRVVAVGPSERVYVWRIRSAADPAPRLVLAVR